jgi:hypothetical protein
MAAAESKQMPHDIAYARLSKGDTIQLHKENVVKIQNSDDLQLRNEGQILHVIPKVEPDTMAHESAWGTMNLLLILFAVVTTVILTFW